MYHTIWNPSSLAAQRSKNISISYNKSASASERQLEPIGDNTSSFKSSTRNAIVCGLRNYKINCDRRDGAYEMPDPELHYYFFT